MKFGLTILLVLAAVFACVWLVKLLNVKDFDKSIREEKKKFFPPPLGQAKSTGIEPSQKGETGTRKNNPARNDSKNREVP